MCQVKVTLIILIPEEVRHDDLNRGGKHRKSALSHFLHFAKVQKCRNIFCTCTQSAEKVFSGSRQKCRFQKCRSAESGLPEVQVQKCRLFSQPGTAEVQIPESASAEFGVQKAEILCFAPPCMRVVVCESGLLTTTTSKSIPFMGEQAPPFTPIPFPSVTLASNYIKYTTCTISML